MLHAVVTLLFALLQAAGGPAAPPSEGGKPDCAALTSEARGDLLPRDTLGTPPERSDDGGDACLPWTPGLERSGF